MPGLEDFMQPSSYEHLATAASRGPVVVLISHRHACFAHVLREIDGQPCGLQIFLSGITDFYLKKICAELRVINDKTRRGVDDEDDENLKGPEIGTNAATKEGQPDTDRAGRPTGTKKPDPSKLFKILWDRVVQPIFDNLGLQPKSGRDRPRLWWCPTGAFTFLPIHAAGIYTEGGQCCSDYVVSSYTPTLGTLLKARESLAPISRKDTKMLSAAVPRPYSGDPLPGTIAELQKISEVVSAENRLPLSPADDAMLGSGAGATVQSILERLPEATILHLACHGKQDPNSPLNSGFIMRDNMLSISKLMPLPLSNAFLAFLSACETAKGDEEQSDQIIHLAAAMLFVGFKSVIGTMWLMNDADGAKVAQTVYQQLFAAEVPYLDPDTVAYALDDAVRRMRREGIQASRWAPFIHLGI
ncbi:hypothetical protein EW026_g5794 [Hermanssonia centrifuga]|uniref:CHAT domain-containing protein n=1 Tax=Hermanssonia centrifuga TaxID=98765 RepID=A0A4S4KE14_9APHY|nr:hypothetical protein EW026_g5794 [Hermanssonia centrifuga]